MARQAARLYRANLVALFLSFAPFFAAAAAGFYLVVMSVDLRARDLVLVWLARDVLHIIVASFGLTAALIVLADRLAGRPARVGSALKDALRAAPSLLLLSLLSSVFYCLSFFILGPFLRELFVGPPIVITALVLERQRFTEAIARARSLLETNWSRILLYLITFAAGIGLLLFAIQQLALWGVSGRTVNAVSYVLAGLVSVVIPSLVLPFVACVWLIAYFDTRVRNENFDEAALTTLRPPK